MNAIPCEIWLRICECLSDKDLFGICGVCHNYDRGRYMALNNSKKRHREKMEFVFRELIEIIHSHPFETKLYQPWEWVIIRDWQERCDQCINCSSTKTTLESEYQVMGPNCYFIYCETCELECYSNMDIIRSYIL